VTKEVDSFVLFETSSLIGVGLTYVVSERLWPGISGPAHLCKV
jgi:hypothetical protein